MRGKSVAIALCAYVAGVATMLAFDAFRAQPVVAPTPVVDAPATESSRPRPPREHVSPDVAEPSPESSPKADRDARGYAAADVDVALDADAAHLDALVGQPGLYGLQLRARKPNSTSSTIGSFRLVVPAGADVVPAVLPFTRTEVDEFLREFAEE